MCFVLTLMYVLVTPYPSKYHTNIFVTPYPSKYRTNAVVLRTNEMVW